MFIYFKKLNNIISNRQRKGLLILIITLFFGMLFEVLGLAVLIPAFSIVLDPKLYLNSTDFIDMKYLFSDMPDKQLKYLFLSIVGIIYLLKSIFLIILNHKQNKFLANLSAYFSNTLFNKYMKLPYSFHLKKNSSVLINILQVEINYLNTFCVALIVLFVEVMFILTIIISIIVIEPFGAIVLGLFFGISSILFFQFTKKKLFIWGEERKKSDLISSKYLVEGFMGIKDLKILGRTNYYIDSFYKAILSKAKSNLIRNTLSQIPRYFLETITVLGLILFISIMITIERGTEEIITTLAVFVTASFRIIPSINKIIASLQNIKFYRSSIDIFNREFKIKNNFESYNSKVTLRFQKRIVLSNVTFAYQEDLAPVLKNLNLTINNGQIIGIKGSSGSGKSTFIDLLVGLHTPNKGDIMVDGLSIYENLISWKNLIGYVPQHIFLTDESIVENVALGIPNDQILIDKVISSLKIARLYKFIISLKNGINTVIGENGVQLSGGQRQRLGIARALYHNPDILILDEATASLDIDTEKDVMKAINNLKGEKTILIIAHRISTLDACDKIYIMKDGQLYNSKKDNY